MPRRVENEFEERIDRWHPKPTDVLEIPTSRTEWRAPWSATPTEVMRVSDHQAAVREQSLDILDHKVPPFVDDRLAAYVEMIYLSRDANRSAKNASSYRIPLRSREEPTSVYMREAIDRSERGLAEPYELLATMSQLGLASIELAKLTHLYGYRSQYIEPMRQNVVEAIEFYDGEVVTPPPEEYDIVAHDRMMTGLCHIEFAVTVKRKRLIGVVGSTDIYERSSFIVRLDEVSRIDSQLAEQIRGFTITEEHDEQIDGQESWKAHIMHFEQFIPEVRRLLDEKDWESIIPLSTTVYAHNPIVERLLQDRKLEESANLKHVVQAEAPTLTHMINTGGMPIFNSHDQ